MANLATYKTLYIEDDKLPRVFDSHETFVEPDKRYGDHQEMYTWVKLPPVI